MNMQLLVPNRTSDFFSEPGCWYYDICFLLAGLMFGTIAQLLQYHFASSLTSSMYMHYLQDSVVKSKKKEKNGDLCWNFFQISFWL